MTPRIVSVPTIITTGDHRLKRCDVVKEILSIRRVSNRYCKTSRTKKKHYWTPLFVSYVSGSTGWKRIKVYKFVLYCTKCWKKGRRARSRHRNAALLPSPQSSWICPVRRLRHVMPESRLAENYELPPVMWQTVFVTKTAEISEELQIMLQDISKSPRDNAPR